MIAIKNLKSKDERRLNIQKQIDIALKAAASAKNGMVKLAFLKQVMNLQKLLDKLDI